MTANISLPATNVHYSGYRELPDKIRITDPLLQGMYYKRFYMTMSQGPMFNGLYEAFRRIILKELGEQ
jgi:hypothetical protein